MDALRDTGPSTAHETRSGGDVRRWRPVVLVTTILVGVVVLATLWLAVRSKQAADALAQARDGVAAVRSALEGGDPAAARERLAAVQADAARAADLTSDPVFGVASSVPFLGNTPTAVRGVSTTADLLAREVLGPLVDAGSALDPATLRQGSYSVNVRALEEALPSLEAAATGLDEATATLEGLDLAGTPPLVGDAVTAVTADLGELDEQLGTITEALRIMPAMLGSEEPRRYFFAVQSNNEARGTGGLLGTWGILAVDDGTVTVEELAPRSFLDQQVYDTPPLDFGPEYAALYGDQPGSWSSANLSPHYPYAAQLWLEMWRDRTGERLDGVVTIDPVAASYLLAATGPFVMPDGRVIDPADYVRFTEATIYSLIEDDRERDAYLRQVGQATLNRVLRFMGNPQGVLDALARASGERRLLVYSTHPEEQRQLAQMAVGGTLPEGPGPVAGLTIINGAGNKADYYLGQTLDYRLLGCAVDTQRTRITVTLDNGIPPGADLPDYVIGRADLGTPEDPFPTRGGEHRVFAQVYGAEGAVLAKARLDGRPVDVEQGTERGRPVFRTPVTIPAGESATLTLDVLEPRIEGPPRLWTTPLVKPPVETADSFDCEARD